MLYLSCSMVLMHRHSFIWYVFYTQCAVCIELTC